MKLTGKKIWLFLRILMVLILLGISVYFIQKHLHTILSLLRSKNVNALEDYIRAKGRNGKAVLVFLQILETVSIILPSMPVYVTAGVLFGGINGFLLCFITNCILNLCIFFAAQKMDKKTKEIFALPDHAHLQQKIANSSHPQNIVIFMCLMPIVPNGMIPYICANGKMEWTGFLKGLALGSAPAIFLYALFGDAILTFDRQYLPYLAGIAVIIIIVFLLFRRQIASFLEDKLNQKG